MLSPEYSGGQPNNNELQVAQSPDLAPLVKERLGRFVGVPTDEGVRVVGYALPRKIDRKTQKVLDVLFIFPDAKTTHYAVLHTRSPMEKDKELRDQEIASYEETMHNLATPSREPFILSSWIPQSNRYDFDSIAPQVGYFANFMRVSTQNIENERKQAVMSARYLKREGVATNDLSLLDRLGTDVITDLGQFDRKWEEIKRERKEEQSVFDAKFAEMVDIFGAEFIEPDEGKAA